MDEKQSQYKSLSSRYENFKKFILNNNFPTNKFTWYNKRKGEHAIFARLDRASVKHILLSNYPDVILLHLPILGSDHAPILLNVYPLTESRDCRSFKFEVKWFLHDDFFNIVKEVWLLFVKGSSAYQLTKKSICLKVLLRIRIRVVIITWTNILIICEKSWRVFSVNWWLTLMVMLYVYRCRTCRMKFILAIWSSRCIGHKEQRRLVLFEG